MTSENKCETRAFAKFCLHRARLGRVYVERVIGSIRRECIDHVIVFHEGSLRRSISSPLLARCRESSLRNPLR